MSYDKNVVKEKIEIEDIYTLLEYLEAEPQMFPGYIIAKTICHNGDSHKLYYYENSGLFKCYTGGCGTFDIFELITKIQDLDLNQSVNFIVHFFNLQHEIDEFNNELLDIQEMKVFKRYEKIKNILPEENQEIQLTEYDDSILKFYPQPRIENWEKEGISKEVCDFMEIKYEPINGSILIPHRDQNNRLVGIRARTLVQEQEIYGKYKPATLNKKLYNHPLAFNLYGLNKAKEGIKAMKTVIVVESEKSVLQYMSYFGTANNICVAVCGSSISKYQFLLLEQFGIKEMVVGFDRDYKNIGEKDYYQVIEKLNKIYNKFGSKVNLSFLFDKENLLPYKASPLDCGADAFLYLFRNRIIL